MKKSLLALAVLGAFTGVASAQSSVTLFGIVDLSLKSVKNDGTNARKSMANDNLNSNRLGVRGVEDMGGGLRASFHLEGGMSPDDGTAGGFNFTRKSTVGLIGRFGEVRLGRDYTPTFYNTSAFDPFGTNGIGTSFTTSRYYSGAAAAGGIPAAQGAYGVPTAVRANNAISYFLPALGGVYGQVMVAPGEGAAGKYTGGRIGFGAGPVDVSASAGSTDMNASGTAKAKVFNVAGSYKVGPAKLFAQYNNEKMDATAAVPGVAVVPPTAGVPPVGNNGTAGSAAVPARPEAKEVRILLGANVTMGQGEIRGSYVKSDNKTTGADNNDATHISLGYIYNLSPRTALYGTWGSISNKGLSNFSIAGGSSIAARPTAGGKSTGYEGGLRHIF